MHDIMSSKSPKTPFKLLIPGALLKRVDYYVTNDDYSNRSEFIVRASMIRSTPMGAIPSMSWIRSVIRKIKKRNRQMIRKIQSEVVRDE